MASRNYSIKGFPLGDLCEMILGTKPFQDGGPFHIETNLFIFSVNSVRLLISNLNANGV